MKSLEQIKEQLKERRDSAKEILRLSKSYKVKCMLLVIFISLVIIGYSFCAWFSIAVLDNKLVGIGMSILTMYFLVIGNKSYKRYKQGVELHESLKSIYKSLSEMTFDDEQLKKEETI